MIAIVSDVHANLEALQAVYHDIVQRGIKRIFFLGDIVGYGPNPAEVLDFIQHFEFCLLGNHDQAALRGPLKTFNKVAQSATWWTHDQLNPENVSAKFLRKGLYEQKKKHWEFLQNLKPVRNVGDTMFVHDYPAEPGSWKYVRKAEDALRGFGAHPQMRLFFFGHSHIPGVWTRESFSKPEPGQVYRFDQPLMVNVGSVGQPRDKDPRACYVILEPDCLRFYRVPYDVAKTQAKIRATPELDDVLADRLGTGT
ncbi:MAG: metallophosphoesterase family protein [Planctomycetes bacterium]|nr:metallophosphoesterase family protein [Planctomycetota bacterium]